MLLYDPDERDDDVRLAFRFAAERRHNRRLRVVIIFQAAALTAFVWHELARWWAA